MAVVERVRELVEELLAPEGVEIVDLEFAIHTRETFESRLKDTNVFRVRHARAMLATYDQGYPIRRYSYPVQAIRFGKDLTLVALGGEVVVDYALRLKKEIHDPIVWVSGYSNDVMTYIPSLRVLNEDKPPLKVPRWGYEGNHALIVYGLPAARWADDVEDLITTSAHRLVKRLP